MQKHAQVFKEGLGTLQGAKANIRVDPTATPIFHKGRCTRGVLFPEHAPCSFCTASTHKGSYCESLLHVMVHTRHKTKETWCGIADIYQMKVSELVQNYTGRRPCGQIKTEKVDSFENDDDASR